MLAGLMAKALALLGETPSPLRARLLARRGGEMLDLDIAGRRAATTEALAIARAVGDPSDLSYVLDAHFMALWSADRLDERTAIADEMLELSEAEGDLERCHQAHHWRMMCDFERGDIAAARTEIDAQVRIAEELRQPLQHWYATVAQAMLEISQGRLTEGERLAEEGMAIGQGLAPVALETYVLQLGIIRREQARLAEIESFLTSAVEAVPHPGVGAILAGLLTELGNTEPAREVLVAGARDGFVFPDDQVRLYALFLLAECCHLLGLEDPARRLLVVLSPYGARNVVVPLVTTAGAVDHAVGLLYAVTGDHEAAIARLEAAVEMNARMGAAPARARSQLELARLLASRSAADHERAGELLRDADDTAARLGLVAVGAAVAAARAAVKTPRGVRGPGGWLTTREADVLRLIALGKSNREIAADLFIAEKTVRNHVSNVFAKLHVADRTQAALYAVRNDLVP
jgi:ATP/maltotriose-dependent transcriptional regulator MalT